MGLLYLYLKVNDLPVRASTYKVGGGEGKELQLYLFLISALDGGELSTSTPTWSLYLRECVLVPIVQEVGWKPGLVGMVG